MWLSWCLDWRPGWFPDRAFPVPVARDRVIGPRKDLVLGLGEARVGVQGGNGVGSGEREWGPGYFPACTGVVRLSGISGTCRKESGSESFHYGVIDGGRFGYE